MGGRAALATALLALAGLWAPVAAQEAAPAPLRSPILTLDQDRLFADSQTGQAIMERVEDDSAALAAENRRIEAELIAEERELTERRAGLPADQFRALAEAFDEKVVAIRRAQDTKARAIAQRRETAQQEFYRQALPLLAELVRDRGAVAVLDRGAVILSAEQVDITDAAIALLDERIAAPGDDSPAPETPADPAPPGTGAEQGD